MLQQWSPWRLWDSRKLAYSTGLSPAAPLQVSGTTNSAMLLPLHIAALLTELIPAKLYVSVHKGCTKYELHEKVQVSQIG